MYLTTSLYGNRLVWDVTTPSTHWLKDMSSSSDILDQATQKSHGNTLRYKRSLTITNWSYLTSEHDNGIKILK